MEQQAEPVAMVARAELLVLAGRPVVRLARLVRMASTVTEVRLAMAATEVRALTGWLEQLGRPQANLEQQAEPAAMVVQAELLVLAAQPVAPLARLGPTASTAMVGQLAMVATAARVLQALMEQPCLQMVALAG